MAYAYWCRTRKLPELSETETYWTFSWGVAMWIHPKSSIGLIGYGFLQG
jgi:hypothetical protein